MRWDQNQKKIRLGLGNGSSPKSVDQTVRAQETYVNGNGLAWGCNVAINRSGR